MPRAPKKVKRKACRPKIPIDWDMVDRLLEAGNNGVKIAGYIGCSPETLRERCEIEKGTCFSSYLAQKRSKGDALILLKQFSVAMGGSNTMLVWLGKNRLGQKDDPKIQEGYPSKLERILDDMKGIPEYSYKAIDEDNRVSEREAD